MQNVLLLSGLALLGLGVTGAVLLRGRSHGSSTHRMPIDLDFDAAKLREQKRR